MSLFDDEVILTQKNLALVLKTPLDDDTLLIRQMTADEEMSRPFRFSLDMVSEDLEIDPKKVLGHPFSVKLEPIPKDEDNSLLGQAGALLGGGGDEEPKERFFHGIVTRFQIGAAVLDPHSSKGGFRSYHAEIIPKLGMLAYATNCRIFQEKTVVDIIEAVLKEHGISSGTD